MNHSSTICCAALILLEGLTAEQALERARAPSLGTPRQRTLAQVALAGKNKCAKLLRIYK